MNGLKKVKMLKTKPGSPDGVSVRVYDKGKEYDLPEDLANVFLKELKCCELIKPPTAAEVAEAAKIAEAAKVAEAAKIIAAAKNR